MQVSELPLRVVGSDVRTHLVRWRECAKRSFTSIIMHHHQKKKSDLIERGSASNSEERRRLRLSKLTQRRTPHFSYTTVVHRDLRRRFVQQRAPKSRRLPDWMDLGRKKKKKSATPCFLRNGKLLLPYYLRLRPPSPPPSFPSLRWLSGSVQAGW